MRKAILFSLVIIVSINTLAQNVGIGTTSPTSKLHVKGTGSGTQIVLEENAGSILRISNEPAGTGPYVGTTTNHPLSLVTNNAVRVSISTGGNVGIGQSSPTSPLHFANTLGNKIALWGTSPNHYGIGIQSLQMQFYTSAATDDIVFGYGNSAAFTENMRIKGNGKAGIGTTNPQQMLSVAGGMVVDQDDNNSGTTTGSLRFGSNSGEAIGSKRTAGTNQWGMDFYTNSQQRMTISNGGNVGINTINPQTTLDVNGDVNIENKLLLNNIAGNDGQVLVSNGNAAAPEWKNVAYGNNDRFFYSGVYQSVSSGSNFSDTLEYTNFYALSSAVTYSNPIFTVNKSGLYSIEMAFNPITFLTSSSSVATAYVLFLIKPPSLSYSSFTIDLQKLENFNPQGPAFRFEKLMQKNMSIYLSAGTQFFFYGGLSSGNMASVVNNAGFYSATPLAINLIAE